MPTTSWIGNAANIAQEITATVTAVAVGGTLTATINTKALTYTCITGDTTTTAAAALAALLNSSDASAEFGLADYSSDANVLTALASAPGTPFSGMTNGLTFTAAAGAAVTQATVQANVSQSDANNANNWLRSGSRSLPQNGDDVVLANSNVPILWNLDALAAVQFASFTRYQSFVASVGLPENNPLGFYEFRPTYFQFTSSVAQLPVILGVGPGRGPSRERYNVGSVRTNLTVIASGQPVDMYAIRFLGTHVNNTLKILASSVGVAMLPTEAASGTAVIDIATVDGGGRLDCGPGVTFTGTGGGGTLTLTGGTCNLFCTPATVVARNGAVLLLAAQSGVYASLSIIDGCNVKLMAPMTITALSLLKSSTLDNSNNLGAVTITNGTIDADTCQILDPNNGITNSNGLTANGRCTAGPFQFTGSRNLRIT